MHRHSGHSSVLRDRYNAFKSTIGNNIRIAKPDATDIEVVVAAKMAHCYSFIQRFPNGYETLVGEIGGGSGGERQRISIARTILKDAPVFFSVSQSAARLYAQSWTEKQSALDPLA